MKRTALTLTLALLFGCIGLAWSQTPAQRVIIMDSTGTHAASVSGGNLGTSASVTVDNIAHITSALHVAGIAQTVLVNCVTGCSASAGVTGSTHVSVALHVAGTINGAQFHIQGLGVPGQAHGGVLTIQGVAGGVAVPISGTITAGDAINVFHQSTIRHISSLTHVVIVDWQRWAHVASAQSGIWNVTAHQGGAWINLTVAHIAAMQHVSIVDLPRWAHMAVAQSGIWNIAAAHQGGQWTIAHITSVTHIAGSLQIQDRTCTTCRARVDHYNVLVVQPHISGALRTWQVNQCGTTASLAINTNANRRDLWVMNRGNGNIYIGYGATGHVALTTANGWPLHATASAITSTARHSTALSTVYLQNYQGPLACISDLAGQSLQVMEILR